MERRFTTTEAGRRLGVSTRTIQRWIEEGMFPGAYRLNPRNPRSHVRIPEADLLQLEQQRCLRAEQS
jgi:excisionase family DNA binding protein